MFIGLRQDLFLFLVIYGTFLLYKMLRKMLSDSIPFFSSHQLFNSEPQKGIQYIWHDDVTSKRSECGIALVTDVWQRNKNEESKRITLLLQALFWER